MSREIQPLNEATRKLDPVYIDSKHGGHYMMAPDEGENSHLWVVRGKVDADSPYYRIGAFTEDMARRVLHYAAANDVSMRAALQALWWDGEPDLLFSLVNKAMTEPPTKRNITFDISLTVEAPRWLSLDAVESELTLAIRGTLARRSNLRLKDLKVTLDVYDA